MTTPAEQARWIADRVAQGELERVTADVKAAAARINDAAGNVKAARKIAVDSPTLAIAGFHDAARKAITAHMLTRGLRPANTPGGHRRVVEYAAEILDEQFTRDEIKAIDLLRRDRATAEYGDASHPILDQLRLRAAGALAESVVKRMSALIADEAKPTP